MPLISGRDAESFDTFDVAKMTDHRTSNQPSQQRRVAGAGGSTNNPWYARHTLSPTPEADDITSLGSRGSSSGGRRSEEAMDRVGSMGVGGGRVTADANNSIPRLSQSSTSNSVGSMNSYHTNSVSLSNNSDKMNYSYNSHNSGSFNSNVPLYETVDNLDEMQHDPRNPFNRGQGGQGQGHGGQGGTLRDSWGDHISEEDENSLSTMEDSSSVSPSVNNQYSRSQQLQQQMQTHTPRSHHRQQRHRLSNDTDDSSVASHQSSRQEFSNKKKTTRIDNNSSSHIIQQLESQVLKINLELATTKTSLDELQLENRRLTDDKAKMSTDVTLLLQENEQLTLKIERMEREIILRNMESTKGVGTRRSSEDSTTGWGGGDTNNVYVTKKRLGKKLTDDNGSQLEVPFRSTAALSSSSSSNEYHLRPKRSSLCSVTSYNEIQSDDDVASRGDGDCRSVVLSDNDGDLRNSSMSAENLEYGAGSSAQKSSRLGLLNIIGGAKKQPSVREITKQVKEAAISFPSSHKNNGEAENKDAASSSSQSSPLPKNQQHLEGNKITTDDDDIGSNPQGEGEDFNDDDPFSTWSAPGDPKRKETEQNWFQRGLGGRVTGVGENSNSNNNTKNNSSQPPPQSSNEDEMMTDPFDSYNDATTRDGIVGDEYISFADSASGKSEDGDMQDKKRFGLFKGFMGKRR